MASSRHGTRVLRIRTLVYICATVLPVLQVGVTLVPFGAFADVAWSVGRVEALAVVADTCIGVNLSAGFITSIVSDSPIHHQRRPATVAAVKFQRAHVARPEAEGLGLHEHRVAAAADVVDLRRVEARVEPDAVVLQTPGDGRLAAAYPGARPVVGKARRQVASLAHGDAPACVPAHVVVVGDVRQRLAPDDRELVAGVGDRQRRAGEVDLPVVVVHVAGARVVASGGDGVHHPGLPGRQGDAANLHITVERPVDVVAGVVVDVVAVQVEAWNGAAGGLAAVPDAELVGDVYVAALPLAAAGRRRRSCSGDGGMEPRRSSRYAQPYCYG